MTGGPARRKRLKKPAPARSVVMPCSMVVEAPSIARELSLGEFLQCRVDRRLICQDRRYPLRLQSSMCAHAHPPGNQGGTFPDGSDHIAVVMSVLVTCTMSVLTFCVVSRLGDAFAMDHRSPVQREDLVEQRTAEMCADR